MKNHLWILAVSAALLATTGCYKIRYITSERPTGGYVNEQWHHSFLNGFIPVGEVKVSQACPGGKFAMVENELSFLNALLSGLVQGALGSGGAVNAGPYGTAFGTGGAFLIQLWTPSTVRIHCAGGQSNMSPALPMNQIEYALSQR